VQARKGINGRTSCYLSPSTQALISALVARFSVLPAFQSISGYWALNSELALSIFHPYEKSPGRILFFLLGGFVPKRYLCVSKEGDAGFLLHHTV
jgi:hypothetical protein